MRRGHSGFTWYGPSMSEQPQALLGALAADALAMPAHWYYDREALQRDYGNLSSYVAPKSPHPDSILWRSSYTPLNERGEILHEQARFWGQRGIHYHQFLQAGENTLNFQLAARLYEQTLALGRYDADAWLAFYIDFMLHSGPPPRHLRRGIPPGVLHPLRARPPAPGLRRGRCAHRRPGTGAGAVLRPGRNLRRRAGGGAGARRLDPQRSWRPAGCGLSGANTRRGA